MDNGPRGETTNDINKISDALIDLRKIIPSDFNRKPRPLKYIKLWKATELRLFLLYLGPVVVKNIPKKLYEHFLILHVAITILANPVLSLDPLNVTYAQDLLRHFTEEFETLYGVQYISYNVHNLLHLAADVREHGPLDNFSTFRFENYIGVLIKYVRKGDKPLQQIARRMVEYNLSLKKTKIKCRYSLEKRHHDDPLDAHYNILNVKQYKIMRTSSFFINCNDNANNCCLLEDGSFIESVNFIKHQNTSYIIGRQLLSCGNLYSVPTDSSDIAIVIVTRQNDIKSWMCSSVKMKLMKIPYNDNFIVLPIIHTNI